MQKIITLLLVLVGIIHLLPVTGVLGAERLAALYGLTFREANVEILMRHRALLFGLLGLFLVYAGFRPALQPLALVAGLVSVVSFIAVAGWVGGYNDAIHRVVVVDVVAALCLLVATALYLLGRR